MASTTAVPGTAAAQAAQSTVADDPFAPVYMEEPAGAAGVASHDGGHEDGDGGAVAYIDLDNPDFLQAEDDTDHDIDPYAQPLPLLDGRWLVTLKQLDKTVDGQPARYSTKWAVDRDKNPIKMKLKSGGEAPAVWVYFAIEATVVDLSGKYDGLKVYDYQMSNRKNRNGGVPTTRLIQCLGGVAPSPWNAKGTVDEVGRLLLANPKIEIETAWEGQVDRETQERYRAIGKFAPSIRGMHKFPQRQRQVTDPTNPSRKITITEPIPEIKVNTPDFGDVWLRAMPRIIGYFPVGSAKASGLEYGPRGR